MLRCFGPAGPPLTTLTVLLGPHIVAGLVHLRWWQVSKTLRWWPASYI